MQQGSKCKEMEAAGIWRKAREAKGLQRTSKSSGSPEIRVRWYLQSLPRDFKHVLMAGISEASLNCWLWHFSKRPQREKTSMAVECNECFPFSNKGTEGLFCLGFFYFNFNFYFLSVPPPPMIQQIQSIRHLTWVCVAGKQHSTCNCWQTGRYGSTEQKVEPEVPATKCKISPPCQMHGLSHICNCYGIYFKTYVLW